MQIVSRGQELDTPEDFDKARSPCRNLSPRSTAAKGIRGSTLKFYGWLDAADRSTILPRRGPYDLAGTQASFSLSKVRPGADLSASLVVSRVRYQAPSFISA